MPPTGLLARLALPPPGAPPRPTHGDPSGWRRHSSTWRGRSSTTKGPHRAGGLGSEWPSLPGRGTKDQSGQRPRRRRRGRAPPPQGRQNPWTARTPRRRAGWPHTGGGGWRHLPAPPPPLVPGGRPPATCTRPRAPHPLRWRAPAAASRALCPMPRARPLQPPQPPPPTHWAGPRPPGPFKPGPYQCARRGRPGRAGWLGAQAGAAPLRGQGKTQSAARAP